MILSWGSFSTCTVNSLSEYCTFGVKHQKCNIHNSVHSLCHLSYCVELFGIQPSVNTLQFVFYMDFICSLLYFTLYYTLEEKCLVSCKGLLWNSFIWNMTLHISVGIAANCYPI
jgi:hypothetical protein